MHDAPTLKQATKTWARIGALSFGGPAAQIALMHREVVDRQNWLSERQFLNALSFCMLLPGPEAMQLATYAGWRLHGTIGGLIAGLLFVLPGSLVVMALATVYVAFGKLPLVAAIFLGIKATVVVIVVEALLKVSRRALKRQLHWVLAVLAFAGIFFFSIPFPAIVLAAGLIGALSAETGDFVDAKPTSVPFSWTLRTVILWLIIWWVPVACIDLLMPGSILTEIALFFSQLAVVTFGGAYAVLAYMAQDAVTLKGWLTTGQMMDGLGLAETTPGPLILVTQFVGFLAGYAQNGLGFAAVAAFVTLWVTFTPCFLWIFAGAPYIDRLSQMPRLQGALAAITAAVVGVILNLSLWFALHVFFGTVTRTDVGPAVLWLPDLTTHDPLVAVLAALAAFLLLVRHWPIYWVLALSGGLAGGVSLLSG
ncbi:MAG: chromate efflux transporter [Pseudomonadota bacterium]